MIDIRHEITIEPYQPNTSQKLFMIDIRYEITILFYRLSYNMYCL